VVRSCPVFVLFVSFVLILLISGCGGASPETRARQTMTARLATQTPTPLQATWTTTALAQRTVVRIDHEQAVILTAEAFLPVARPLPPNASIIVVGQVRRLRDR